MLSILDIYSWVPAKELSLERIRELVLSLYRGECNDEGYSLEMTQVIDMSENIRACTEELRKEGRMICYLLKRGVIICVIGYILDQSGRVEG